MYKKTQQFLCGLMLALIGCVHTYAAESAQPAGMDKHAGIVKSVRGSVQLISPGSPARPVAAGDSVAPIDRVQTGPDSGASVVLRDGTTLVIGPSSRMDLKQFRFDATTHEGNVLLSLLRGTLRMTTGLIGKAHPDAIQVETPTAVIGIRGTDFIVEADPKP